jgi:hypothetical protein
MDPMMCALWAAKLALAAADTALASFLTSREDETVLAIVAVALSAVCAVVLVFDKSWGQEFSRAEAAARQWPLVCCVAVDTLRLLTHCVTYARALLATPHNPAHDQALRVAQQSLNGAWIGAHANAFVLCVTRQQWFVMQWLIGSMAWTVANRCVFHATCASMGV